VLDASTMGAIELFTSGKQRKGSFPVQVTQQAEHFNRIWSLICLEGSSLRCILADD